MTNDDLLDVLVEIGTSNNPKIPQDIKRKAIELHHDEWIAADRHNEARNRISLFIISLLKGNR